MNLGRMGKFTERWGRKTIGPKAVVRSQGSQLPKRDDT